jgi:hypothetical protein
LGFRTPGEKTKYEVQSLENAASRVFQNKIRHLELHIIEPSLNDMLDLARRNMNEATIRIIDDEFKIGIFKTLTRHDLAGIGMLRPMAARHFAEKAQLLQNMTGFFSSPIGQDPAVSIHFGSIAMAKMFENILEIEKYNVVQPYVRITEQAEAQRLSSTTNEQLLVEQQTPSGLNGDFDLDVLEETTPVE